MKIQRRSNRGFTLVEVMIIITIIGLLAAIAIPNFVEAKHKADVAEKLHTQFNDADVKVFCAEKHIDEDVFYKSDVAQKEYKDWLYKATGKW